MPDYPPVLTEEQLASVAAGKPGASRIGVSPVANVDISEGVPAYTVQQCLDIIAGRAVPPVDGAAGTGSLRTLGPGALQAAPGNDARFPTATQQDALTGSHGTPSDTNRYVTVENPALADARIPQAHAPSHDPGGTDALTVDAAAATGSLRTLGTGAQQAAPGTDSRFPVNGQKAALAGTQGTPSDTNRYVTTEDARNTDARAPTAHAASHQPGGADAMAVDAVAATGSLRTLGTGAQQAAAGNDARLSDARAPTAHAHSGADVTSGTVPVDRIGTGTKDTTTFYRGDGTFALPASAAPATEAAAGVGEIATQAETDAGTDDARFVTPLKLQGRRGAADGLASLDENQRLPATQAPVFGKCDLGFVTGDEPDIPHNTWVKVPWATEFQDPDDWHSDTVDVSRVAPGVAGEFVVTAYMQWSNTSTVGARRQRIVVSNDSANPIGQDAATQAGTSVGTVPQTTTAFATLDATDYLEVEVLQTSGATLPLHVASVMLVRRIA